MKKHYNSNKYDKQRKYYDNPRPVQNTVNTGSVAEKVHVAVTNVQDHHVASNGIKNDVDVSSTNSNGNTTNSGLVPGEKFLINV
jgi:hypothetical protein